MVTENGKIPLSPIGALIGGMAAGCFSTIGNNPFGKCGTQSMLYLTK